ncbi:MAG TPA: undecaprenyldiphospho-muramoylpentapeptide beta-N-acetylglucosaminyltransferase [Thermoleophilaceae bacterium]|nr:undecaprenyldiphospho-muramoylpentapeptide beta-N-acetylglucosaminyltransferase [Thermoleophilaceae bacterium]
MTRIVIAAGGTAGHVVPALAVAAALRERGAEVAFVGGERAEAELVPAAGYPFHRLRVIGIDRRHPARAARAVGLAALATALAPALLRRLRADVVLGGGGYVAGPVGLAAALLRIPLALSEADSHMGLANRLLSPLARRVFLAFPPEQGARPGRQLVTGRPIPAATLSADREAARARFDLPSDRPCLLVFGGSLGARSLNEAAVEAFAGPAGLSVLHACGRRDYETLATRLHELGSPSHYHLHPYIEPFADALAAADLAAARAGGSVFELAAAGLPALLVPYPQATGDHQSANARWMAAGGAAIVVADSELDADRLAREVGDLVADPARLDRMARAARALARPDAAERIAEELLGLASGEGSRGRGEPSGPRGGASRMIAPSRRRGTRVR